MTTFPDTAFGFVVFDKVLVLFPVFAAGDIIVFLADIIVVLI
jgi:hypothetical protein